MPSKPVASKASGSSVAFVPTRTFFLILLSRLRTYTLFRGPAKDNPSLGVFALAPALYPRLMSAMSMRRFASGL